MLGEIARVDDFEVVDALLDAVFFVLYAIEDFLKGVLALIITGFQNIELKGLNVKIFTLDV